MTSATSTASIRGSATSATSSSSCAPPPTAGCGSSPTWSSTTPPTSTRGSRRRGPTPTRRCATSTSGATSPPTSPKGLAFPDKETSNWTRDRKAGQYYLHRFYHFQPDLNVANPAVRDEIAQDRRLLAGARGLGLPHGRRALPARDRRADRAHGRRSRRTGCATCARSPTAGAATRCCSARSTRSSRTSASYFGGEHGDELHMQFAFLLNQQLWLASRASRPSRSRT